MIRTTPWTGGSEEEYETQHFGFGSQRLKIAVRQMAEQKITNGVKEMESSVTNSLNLNETDKATLTKSFDKMVRLFFEQAELSLDVVDNEIERVLKIPRNVLLPDDECQLAQTSDFEYQKLEEEIAQLEKRIERGALMEVLLKAEVEEISKVDSVCETSLKDMEVLDRIIRNNDINCKPMLNDTMFLCASVNHDVNNFDIIH